MPPTPPSERDALLAQAFSTRENDEEGSLMAPHSRVGPTEISQSTRWGILAGVWSATFLSVRSA